MAYRATKSGLAAETHAKCQAKYDESISTQCLQWIQSITGESFSCAGDRDNFQNVLMDGYILLKLMNTLQQGIVPANIIKKQQMPFKRMDCIGKAVDAMVKYGVPDQEKFVTGDLYEATNLSQVQLAISALARKAQSKGMPGFGPKEADANVRHFSEEQLKAGQNVIGLQMGTNKGASQAGMNIGKSRHIVD